MWSVLMVIVYLTPGVGPTQVKIDDHRGPYATKEACIERADEMAAGLVMILARVGRAVVNMHYDCQTPGVDA